MDKQGDNRQARKEAREAKKIYQAGGAAHTAAGVRGVAVAWKAAAFLCEVISGLFFPLLTIIGLYEDVQRGNTDAGQIAALIGVAMAVMLIGMVLFLAIRSRRWIGLIVMAIASVFFIVAAVELGSQYPEVLSSSGTVADYGLTPAKLVVRHYSPVLIPVLLCLFWLFDSLSEEHRMMEESAQRARIQRNQAENLSTITRQPVDSVQLYNHDDD